MTSVEERNNQGLLTSQQVTKGCTVLQGALTQSTVGMATGSILGGVDAVITGENFWNGFVNGGLKGFRDGFLTGAYSGYQYAKQNDLNPWTGNPTFKGDSKGSEVGSQTDMPLETASFCNR